MHLPSPAHARSAGTAARSRLDQAPDAYALALSLADELDDRGLDLWAAGIRSCLDAGGSTARQQHLAVELTRLRSMGPVRAAGLDRRVEEALARLEAGLGRLDVPVQPLYAAARELAEHLELQGGRRWLARLRTVLGDPERTAAARVQRLAALLDRIRAESTTTSAEGSPLPPGTAARVEAVTSRLPRHRDAEEVARYLAFALQPPAPSRRVDPVGSADGAPA